jgi:translation initiation factor 2 subunit 1
MQYEGWPEPGELVVGEVTEIEEFGVFVDLEEYADTEGLVHVSEVASGWIKNVSDHVSEGERVVAKVLDVDKSSQQIDLSIKDVNDHQRKETIQRWRNDQKADNWMERAVGDRDDDTFGAIANALIDAHGTLYDAFEEAAIHGDEALDDTELDDDVIDDIVAIARENVSVPYVTVTGYVDLRAPGPDGVEDVKEALVAAEGNGDLPDEIEIEVSAVGAPQYRIRVQAPDYKTAESTLEDGVDRASDAIEAVGGTAEYHRERRDDS